MNTPQPRKPSTRILLALAAAGMALLLLAISVGQTRLGEGYSLSLPGASLDGQSMEAVLSSGDFWVIVFRAFLALALAIFPFYLFQSLRSKQGRQQLLANVIIIAAMFVFVRCLEQRPEPEMTAEEEEQQMLDNLGMLDIQFDEGESEPLPEIPAEPPNWVSTIVVLLIALLVVGIAVTAYLVIRRRKQHQNTNALERVAEQAEDALRKIRSGGDFQSAILNCYYEMNRIIREELRISRDTTMTARDFEAYLEGKGFPALPLQQLTILFERARYSNQPPDAQQEQTAVAALTALAEHVHQRAANSGGTA